MQSIKTRADELTALGKPLDQEDLIEKVLEGLDENYEPIIDVVNGRNSTISFDELHEKLINKELSLRNKISPSPLLASAHATNVRSTPWSVTNRIPWLPSTQGHVVSCCPLFRQQFPQVQPPPRPGNSSQFRPPAAWKAQANVATTIPLNTTWLLDSGASHHVTIDLHNLALHSPFDGTDEIMIGDGSGLPISHTGSTSLTTLSHSFTLSNDLQTRAILLQGRTKDGVYEWPLSTTQSRPLITFSSVKTTLSEWHHRLALSSFLTINGVSHLAFSTVVYLINRLPTPTLHHISPYFKLFGTFPNYSKLRSFGCLCYPWLRPYTSHKLESRSSPCVFVGYSPTQTAYLCLDTSTAHLYTSHHVRFIESIFLFVTSHTSLPRATSSTISEWCSMTLPVVATPSVNVGSAPSSSLLTPTAPSQSQDPSQHNTTCATPTPKPDSHSNAPVPETKCDCANNPPLPPTQNDPNQPPVL
ncbi:Retrovirus-related Pol polyprotein from transposon RE1 [Vitis vinifera]|uniref:Retrovirus-related Pol polyprotein from transposon RE1 n=1 Tax=Vitis vinifera TaxID=29760 RepID=A0A438FNC4_VITVI|nr:Retrovirus-related Pol polyprotein from transposon RE1 [Vitis vinifera]